jgi:hypothetical protein
MTETTYTKSDLQKMGEMRIELHDDRYEAVEIVGCGEFLYDPQVFWDWDPAGEWANPPGSILVSEIGGQRQHGWDPTMGHGAIYRLHPDNRIETIMAPAVGRQAGVFRPAIAPKGWGDYGGNIFFGSQIIPGRRGAVMEHMIYRLAPGETRPHPFAIVPRSGTIAGGMPGAMMVGTFGRPGTPEEGLLLTISMHNCTVYAARPDGSIEPWIVMDGVNGPGPVMPYRIYYAHDSITGERDMLVIEGVWGTSFGVQNHNYKPGHYRVQGRTVLPEPIEVLAGGPGPIAPAGFGPYAGQMFRPDHGGFISSVHWTKGSRQALPYTDKIVRRDENGEEFVFASNLQAGQNLIAFAGDRMIVSNMRHSYSSGDFHEPDGSLYAIQLKR